MKVVRDNKGRKRVEVRVPHPIRWFGCFARVVNGTTTSNMVRDLGGNAMLTELDYDDSLDDRADQGYDGLRR